MRASAAAALLASLVAACVPPPAPDPPPAPTAAPVTTAAPAPTAAPAARADALPALHPCVPDFIQKELHACEPGAEPADYSAVANAMAAMSAAGPVGPRRKENKPVPRDLEPLEQKAASTARAFLCRAPAGDLDDEHATSAFDLGRLYLHANHFEEAVVYLRDVAVLDPQKHAEVEYAARFLLDAMRPLGEARPECKAPFTAMLSAVEQHVCKSPSADARAESCAAISAAKAGPTPPP
jgi:hypothetical protein